MAQSIVDELVTLLGFKVDPNAHPTAAKFTRSIDEISKYALAASASIMAAAASLLYFAEKSAHAGAEIERFHQLTGMSTDSIQQWSYAAQQISGNKQSILTDIESITSSLNPIMPGDFNQGMYLFFGSRLKDFKDANSVLRELAKTFPKLSEQKGLQWGRLMGISPETVMLLRQGEAGLDRLFAKAKERALTPKETKEALRFAQQWDDLKDRVQKFSVRIGITLLPILEKLFSRFERWWAKNHTVAEKGFKKFVDALMEMSGWLGKLIDHAEIFIGLWIGSKLISGLTGILGIFTKLSALMLTMKETSTAIAATEAIGGVAAGGAVGGGILGLLARFLPPPLAGALAALYVLKPTNVNDVDEEAKITSFNYNQSEWGKKLKGLDEAARNRNKVNLSYLESNGTSRQLIETLKQLQDDKTPQGGMTQNNTIQIQSTDPYGAGRETVYQLERMASPALAGTWR